MSTQFFCHYNLTIGEISKISPQAEKDDPDDSNIFVFEIPEKVALSMLSGETGPQEWIAIKPQDDTIPQPYELVKRLENAMNKLSRVDGSFIVMLEENGWDKGTDLITVVDTVNKLVDVYICIKTLYITNEKYAEVFMTTKNDSSYLLNSFKIDLADMKKNILSYDTTRIFHARARFSCPNIPDDFSMYATRIFNTFSLEIQHDNPPNE